MIPDLGAKKMYLQSVGVALAEDEPWVLLNGDGGAGVGAGGAAGREAGGVHLGQVVPGGLPLQGQLNVQVLGDGRVHDATRQDVGETAVVTRAPVNRRAHLDLHLLPQLYGGQIIKVLAAVLHHTQSTEPLSIKTRHTF